MRPRDPQAEVRTNGITTTTGVTNGTINTILDTRESITIPRSTTRVVIIRQVRMQGMKKILDMIMNDIKIYNTIGMKSFPRSIPVMRRVILLMMMGCGGGSVL